jgi:hypothetical protein
MGEWLVKRCTRAADAVMVSAGIMAGLLGALWLFGAFTTRPAATLDNLDANLARVERYEARAANTLGPVDLNTMAVPQEDSQ